MAPARDQGTATPLLVRLPSIGLARATWTQLAQRQDNVFATWEWACAWWHAFGGGHELFLHEVRDGQGRTIGILPLYVAATRFGRVVRFIGNGVADQLGPVCGAEHRVDVAAALRALISGPTAPGMLLAERMRPDEGWQARLRGRHVRRQSFPLVDLDGVGWDEWLAGKSANFRQQAGKEERRLLRDHRLEYRLVTAPEEAPAAMDALITLHEARWNGTSSAFDGPKRAFHLEFAQTAAERGWLRIWFAVTAGMPVACWLGYRFGGVESSYQVGRLPAWEHSSVGAVLFRHTIREAAGHVREYRLLSGDEPYKRRLASDDPGLDTCLVGPGAVPRIAHRLVRHKQRLPAAARRVVAAQLGW